MHETYIFRHLPTTWNEEKRIIGKKEVPIATYTIPEKVKNILYSINKVDEIYCSDLLRARQTAQLYKNIIKFEKPIQQNSLLQEVDYGNFSGLLKKDVKEKYPHYHQDPEFVHPNGESFLDMQKRIKQFLQTLPRKNSMVVTHAGCIRAIIALVRNDNLEKYMNLKIHHDTVLKITKNNKIEIL